MHASERAVVYFNPASGERRVPPRADMPMPEVYARQGFDRREILSMSAYERETGTVHEATNFAPGNEPGLDGSAPPTASRAVLEDLARDVARGAASGWTSREGGPEVFTAVPNL